MTQLPPRCTVTTGAGVRTPAVSGSSTPDGSTGWTATVEGVARVEEVAFDLDVPAGSDVHVHRWWNHLGLQQCTVALVRHADGGGTFAMVANPMARADVEGGRLRLSYRPAMDVPGTFATDELVVGSFRTEGVAVERRLLVGRDIAKGAGHHSYEHIGDRGPLDRGEVRAVRAAVAARIPWEPGRCRVSHWDWAANLYRLEVGGDERALPAFRRDAQVAAEIGVEIELLSPNVGDGEEWGLASELGPCLPLMWLGRGERVARMDPDAAELPAAMHEVLDVVRSAGLRPVAYSNPQAPWGHGTADWVAKQESGPEFWACMALPQVQDAAIDAYRTFAERHELAGFSLDFVYWLPCQADDHGHDPGPDSLYAQYRGFLRITEALWSEGLGRDEGPWVEGLIGSQHLMPWGMRHLTHAHPVLTDNQPQWVPAWPDISLFRVCAHQQRRTAWWQRNLSFTPPYKVSGLVAHQQIRRRYLENERGWDFEGSRFNLLSAVMSGPSSLVVGYLPSWDADEWEAMRRQDAPFFAEWIAFAREHDQLLARLEDLYDDPAPGTVDGTWARGDDGRGLVFLANPDADPLPCRVPLDDGWVLRERHPEPGRLWESDVTVEGHTVAVLDLLPWDDVARPALVGAAGTVDAEGTVVAARGLVGSSVPVVTVDASGGRRRQVLTFAEDDLPPPVVGPSWTPGAALPALLRSQAPPFTLDDDERRAPWLDRSRLRFWFDVIDPQSASVTLRVDGEDVPVRGCYVGLWEDVKDTFASQMHNNLMCWYADLTDKLAAVEAAGALDTAWQVEATVEGVPADAFRALRVAFLPRRTTDRYAAG